MKVINTLGELITAFSEEVTAWDDYLLPCLYWREIGENPLLWQSNLYYKGNVGMIRKSVLEKLKMHTHTREAKFPSVNAFYMIDYETMIAISRKYKINKLFSDEK